MSKNTDNLDMVTFQPFGEETLQSNEEELKKTTSSSKKEEVEREISHKSAVKVKNSKSEKFNGVIIGLVVAFLFVAYDMFKGSL